MADDEEKVPPEPAKSESAAAQEAGPGVTLTPEIVDKEREPLRGHYLADLVSDRPGFFRSAGAGEFFARILQRDWKESQEYKSNLAEMTEKFHKADKENVRLYEKLKHFQSTASSSTILTSVGTLLIGFSPSLYAESVLFYSFTLVIGAAVFLLGIIKAGELK